MDQNQNESPAIWWCYRYDVCIFGFGSGQNLMVYFRLSKYSSSWSRMRTARGRWIYVPLWTVLSRDRSLRCTTCCCGWPMTRGKADTIYDWGTWLQLTQTQQLGLKNLTAVDTDTTTTVIFCFGSTPTQLDGVHKTIDQAWSDLKLCIGKQWCKEGLGYLCN